MAFFFLLDIKYKRKYKDLKKRIRDIEDVSRTLFIIIAGNFICLCSFFIVAFHPTFFFFIHKDRSVQQLRQGVRRGNCSKKKKERKELMKKKDKHSNISMDVHERGSNWKRGGFKQRGTGRIQGRKRGRSGGRV